MLMPTDGHVEWESLSTTVNRLLCCQYLIPIASIRATICRWKGARAHQKHGHTNRAIVMNTTSHACAATRVHPHRWALALIELLIVLGIVAVVISILGSRAERSRAASHVRNYVNSAAFSVARKRFSASGLT